MKKQAITLFGVPNDPDTEQAQEAIKKLKVKIERISCPPLLGEWYQMPFIQNSKGFRYFGIDSIEKYVGLHTKRRVVAR